MSYQNPTTFRSACPTYTQQASDAFAEVQRWSTSNGDGPILHLSSASPPQASYISSLPGDIPGYAWRQGGAVHEPQYVLTKVSADELVLSEPFPMAWLEPQGPADPNWFQGITKKLKEGTLSDVYLERLGPNVRSLHYTPGKEKVTNALTLRSDFPPITLRDNEKNGLGRHLQHTNQRQWLVKQLDDMSDTNRGLVIHRTDLSDDDRRACLSALSSMKRQLSYSVPTNDLTTRFYVETVSLPYDPYAYGRSAAPNMSQPVIANLSTASIGSVNNILNTVQTLGVGGGTIAALRVYPIRTTTPSQLPGTIVGSSSAPAPQGPIGSGKRYSMQGLRDGSEPEPLSDVSSQRPIGYYQ